MGTWWTPAVALGALLVAGCDFPRDAGGTFERARSQQVLRVGFSERPPWVAVEQGRPAGIEPRLIEAFAAQIGATPEWIGGSESSLIEALRARRVDVLVGGYDHNSTWVGHAAATEPYLRAAIIVAAPRGSVPVGVAGLQGRTVAHARLRPDLAALIAENSATPEAASDLRGRLTVVYDFQARQLGLEPAGIVLARTEKVLLVAPGESRLLYELDRFLARVGPRAAAASDKLEGP
jgi:polar amino acid transport system substrate-binding protein